MQKIRKIVGITMDDRKEPRFTEIGYGIALDKINDLVYDVCMVNISEHGAGFFMWEDILQNSTLKIGTNLYVSYKDKNLDCTIRWFNPQPNGAILVGCTRTIENDM